MKTVEITIDDNGKITVGTPPDEATEAGGTPNSMMGTEGETPPETTAEGGQEEGMQEVGSIDEALKVARQLLSAGGPEDRASIAKEVWPPAKPSKPPMPGGMGGGMPMGKGGM